MRAVVDIGFNVDWRAISHRTIHFVRHYTKEIIIALVLAVVAAVVIDRYEKRKQLETTLENLKAVATLVVSDKDGHVMSQGSGFFVAHDGKLVTNYHVVKGGVEVIAKLPSGAFYMMRGIRDIDEPDDIAILQFDAHETPAVSRVGDSDDLYVGESIYAIGTPVNLPATVSTGTVSNPLQQIGAKRFIQFTAPISPGSSGGGLFDEDGAVIGITAAFQSIPSGPQAGTAQNLNLAVPINSVKEVMTGEVGTLVKESPAYYYSLGNLADNKKEWDTAIKYYRKAASLDESYSDAYTGLGGDYYEKGQFDLEVENYFKATETDPQSSSAFYFLATAYEDTGQFDQALVAYEKALQLDPSYRDALRDASVLYLAQGKADRVRALLPRLKAVDEGWAEEVEMLLQRMK